MMSLLTELGESNFTSYKDFAPDGAVTKQKTGGPCEPPAVKVKVFTVRFDRSLTIESSPKGLTSGKEDSTGR